jgi:hypothetical protein
VILTLQRLIDAELPRWLTVLFFVPFVNLLFFAILVAMPSRDSRTASELPRVKPVTGLRRRHYHFARDSYWRSGLVAVFMTVPLTVLLVWAETLVIGSYGFSLFVGAPFAIGFLASLIVGFSSPKPLWICILTGFITGFLGAVGVVVVALEGIICLIMAAPIATLLILFGSVVGYVIQARPWLGEGLPAAVLAVLITLPALTAAESFGDPEPSLREVRTSVDIDATPEQVWKIVIEFPELPEPEDWVFQSGIAYPCRAKINGTGVGAVRECIFSTGAFVEPIDVWNEPQLLAFRVTDQPPPMKELSPFHIHPPHLDNYLKSERGQFRLERLSNGTTRLEGTTWYRNRMWPATYWDFWSDRIIQRIHGRVLTHIKTESEKM